MEQTQDVASPPDQSQPATDPLAIEQPTQSESSVATMDQSLKESQPSETFGSSEATYLSQSAAPQCSQSDNEKIPSTPPEASLAATAPSPLNKLVNSELVTVNTAEQVTKSPPRVPLVDPLDTNNGHQNEAVQQESHTEYPEPTEPSSSSPPPPSSVTALENEAPQPFESTSGVSSTETQNLPEAETPATTFQSSASDKTTALKSSTAEVQESTASKAITSSSDSAANGNNSNDSSNFPTVTNGTSSIGVKHPITGENSLKINGISDLSILDVTEG